MRCNLCDNNKFKFLFKKNGYSIIKCRHCGLVTVSPLPNSKDLNGLYEREYFEAGQDKKGYSQYKEGIKDYFDYVKKEPFIEKRINYLKRFSKGGKLLDIGCAHGFFLKAAEKEGWKVSGVDTSKYACDFGKEKFHLNIINKSLEKANFSPNYFDVVTIWSFVDHCVNPLKLFKEVNRILKIGGVLAFNISNINSFRAMINSRDWRPFRPPEHLYYYSINTANKYLSKTGFGKTFYFGKGEVGIKDIFKTPDLSLKDKKERFNFSFF